jgi:hypothetical protein
MLLEDLKGGRTRINLLEAENERLRAHIDELKCCQGYAGGGLYGWNLERLDKLVAKIFAEEQS